MSKLFIMCGLPFSGKSHTGIRLAEKLKAHFLSFDILWHEIKEKYDRDPTWEEMCIEAERLIEKYLSQGEDLVYDTLNDTVGNRKKLVNLAKKANSNVKIVYMNTPIEVLRERQKDNLISKNRHNVEEDKFQEALSRFEAPNELEDFIEFKPEDNIEAFIKSLT